MLAVITGTIKPDSAVSQLTIRDEEERLKQYIEGIIFLVESRAFSKIIFCENSNYGTGKFEDLRKLADEQHVILELLSFQGNVRLTSFHGKGYGEGEIMKYVFEKSQLIREEDFFVKITGRMKVVNIRDIVMRLNREKTYFNIPNRTLRSLYDTRMYAMPIKLFIDNFINRFDQVMDEKGYYLEHVYTQILKDNEICVTNFPRYPRIVGVSGSTGNVYTYTEWKCKIKDIVSYFGGYKIR